MTEVRVAMLDHTVFSYTWQNSKIEGAQLPNIMDHNIHISPESSPWTFM